MISKEALTKITESKLEGQETLFLVELTVSPSNDIEIVIDSDTYVSIEQCITLSKAIEADLDREVEDFSLSVYSSGIGQPLLKERQFRKCVGKPVEVVLKKGIKITGLLAEFTGQAIVLEYQTKEAVEGKKRKELVTHQQRIEMEEIKSVVQELEIK